MGLRKIALLTDSSSDLSLRTLEENNIKMVPLRIIYKEKEYLDKITLTSKELYKRLKENDEIPTTSLPDLKNIEEVIDELKGSGVTDIIVVTVSSKLSGTYNGIRLVTEEYDDINFHFFDTRTLGYPQGVIALEISKMIKEDKPLEEILNSLEDIRKRTHGFITFQTLEFLTKGGRIGKVAGTIGEMLHLKPIVSSNDEGELYNYAKARGRKKALSKMKDIVNSYLDKGKCKIWVLSADADEDAKKFFDDIKGHKNIINISLEEIGAAMGIHTGPGALGVAILEE